jgi:ethanolamine permease
MPATDATPAASPAQGGHGHLKKVLGPFQLWGIAVGLVISGEYFGWSYGWNTAGTLGFLVATVLVATMYTTFIFSFTELSTAIPHAGGPFAYARRAFGPNGGFVAGFATLIEFVFAPPAIALAIGAYLNVQFPGINPKWFALGAYVIFIGLNWIGVGIAAAFELFVTVLAIVELLVFMGVVTPGWTLANFTANGWAGGSVLNGAAISGIFASIPFAIWFFLAIEGAAMAAEEARDPHRTIPIAYTTGIVTLVVLAFGVMIFAGGVGDWRKLANINDPLPQAMKAVVGENSGWLHMLVWIGLFGLIASFHGIIMGYSRQIFALARAGYLPRYFAGLSPRFDTPHRALLAGGVIGVIAIFSDEWVQFGGQTLTANIVTMAVLGAIVMYLISMAALFKLRNSEPNLLRTYRAPFYPVFPAIALGLGVVCLGAMVWFNAMLTLLFIVLMAAAYGYFLLTSGQREAAAPTRCCLRPPAPDRRSRTPKRCCTAPPSPARSSASKTFGRSWPSRARRVRATTSPASQRGSAKSAWPRATSWPTCRCRRSSTRRWCRTRATTSPGSSSTATTRGLRAGGATSRSARSATGCWRRSHARQRLARSHRASRPRWWPPCPS